MLGLVVLSAIGGLLRLVGVVDEEAPSPDVAKALAFNACKEFVERRLKAPATAKFRSFYRDDGAVSVTGTGDGPYTVRSSVDSENSFGANIRTSFTCTVTRTGEDWRLDAIALG